MEDDDEYGAKLPKVRLEPETPRSILTCVDHFAIRSDILKYSSRTRTRSHQL